MDDPAAGIRLPASVDFDPAIHEDLELVEMANLTEQETGVPGIVYIATMQGSHGPRTKWYPGRPGRDSPCLSITITDPPDYINHGLAVRDVRRGAEPAVRWTSLNAGPLLHFWTEGHTWTHQEVNIFIDSLQKVT